MKVRMLLLGAAALWICLPAVAQWSDNFDSYPNGTVLDNVGGWFGWDNTPACAGTVSNAQSLSTPHSISVSNTLGNDAVHPFTPLTSGAWTFTAHQYIPSGLDGITYFILNNEYNHGGPYEWAIQMQMDPGLGMVNEQLRDPGGATAAPIVYDAWTEIRVEFDLDADTCDAYYNGALIASGTWLTGAYTTLEFANVDLYAPHNEPVYYDDLSLVPEPASCLLLVLAAAAGLRRR
jgi:hypothetical protein